MWESLGSHTLCKQTWAILERICKTRVSGQKCRLWRLSLWASVRNKDLLGTALEALVLQSGRKLVLVFRSSEKLGSWISKQCTNLLGRRNVKTVDSVLAMSWLPLITLSQACSKKELVCVCEWRHKWRPEERAGSSRIGVTGFCLPPAGNAEEPNWGLSP